MRFDINQAKTPGILRRAAAMLYDLVLLFGILLLAVTIVVVPYVELVGPEFPHNAWWYRSYLALTAGGFYAYFWIRGGQTLGMRAWRLRVVRNDGEALRPADALRRLSLAILTLAPFGIGFLWMLVDRQGLTAYDRLSGTRLVVLRNPS